MQACSQNIVMRLGVLYKTIVNIIAFCVFMDTGKQNKTGGSLSYYDIFSKFCILRTTK